MTKMHQFSFQIVRTQKETFSSPQKNGYQKTQWLLLFFRCMVRKSLVSYSKKYGWLRYPYLVSFNQETRSTRLYTVYILNEKQFRLEQPVEKKKHRGNQKRLEILNCPKVLLRGNHFKKVPFYHTTTST